MYNKYSVNENFFNVIDENSAYVLGWLVTDGCIYVNKKYRSYRISFELQDKEILENIKKLMKSNQPINIRERTGLYTLVISSKKIVDKLIELGITPRKSKTTKMPEMEIRFFKHFVRGCFEGDGSVSISSNNKNNSLRLKSYICSGNKKFLEDIGNTLKEEISIIPKIYKEQKDGYDPLYKLVFGAKETYALGNYMYAECKCNYLERKKSIIDKAFELNIATGKAKCRKCHCDIIKTSNRVIYCTKCKNELIKERDKKRKKEKTLSYQGITPTIICKECNTECVRKSCSQKYCETCRDIVRARKQKQYRANSI